MGNTDLTLKSGEMEGALLTLVNTERPNIPKDTVIELRCRYCISQDGYDDFYSPYSKIISFGTDDISQGGNQGTDGTGLDDPSNPAKKTCPICHFCPQPLGLCIFIWLLIILVVVIIIIVIIASKKKKKKEKN